MSNIFVTSDLHFGHNQEFLFKKRGFNTIEEHDEAVIKRWNEVVSNDDIVYCLGDLIMNDQNHGVNMLRRLNGMIKVVYGNHCTINKVCAYTDLYNVTGLGFSDYIKYGNYRFYLSHYPTITSNFDDDKPLKRQTINLCGHSHTNDCFIDWNRYNAPIVHVELDTNNCYPWLIDDIIVKMEEKVNERS